MSIIEVDKVLLSKLVEAKPEEIDYLVDIITDFGKGRIALDSKVKEELIFAKNKMTEERYTDEILKKLIIEFQLFSGNSISNVARKILDRVPVSYIEILINAARHLGFDSSSSKHSELEITIASGVLSYEWIIINNKEKYKKSTSTAILSGLSKSKRKSSILSSVINLSALTSPIYGLTAEANRIIIPFVVQLGCIELRKRREANFAKLKKTTKNLDKNEILIVDENQKELAFFSSFENKEPMVNKATDDQISAFSQFVSNIPSINTLHEVGSNEYVKCNIPLKQLTRVKNSDTAKRGFTQGVKGKFEEHVKLTGAKKLKSIAIKNVAFSALSTIVAQKHLQDIDVELKKINEKLDKITNELEQSKIDKLKGVCEYIQFLIYSGNKGDMSEAVKNTLEKLKSEIYEFPIYFERKIKEKIDEINSIDHGKFFISSLKKEISMIRVGLEELVDMFFKETLNKTNQTSQSMRI